MSMSSDVKTSMPSQVIQTFQLFQSELDAKHDKFERVVKLSRDITTGSKRAIFAMHRIKSSAGNDGCSSDVVCEVEAKLKELEQHKWLAVAKELNGEDPYQFLRAYSPGLQEYIEAVGLLCYIKTKSLVQLHEVQARLIFKSQRDLPCSSNVSVYVPPLEYVLGIADLTGELMRMAVHSLGIGDRQAPFDIRCLLRKIGAALDSFSSSGREIQQKTMTLRQSLAKVEMTCYALHVQGKELPEHLLVNTCVLSRPVYQMATADENFD